MFIRIPVFRTFLLFALPFLLGVSLTAQEPDGIVAQIRVKSVSLHPTDGPGWERSHSRLEESIGALFALLNQGSREGEASQLDYTIYIKGNRIRMDFGGSSMLAGLAADGSVAEIGVLDQNSGRVLNSDVFNAGMGMGSVMESVLDAGMGPNGDASILAGLAEVVSTEFTVEPPAGNRQILGHETRRYDYLQKVVLKPLVEDGEFVTIGLAVKGHAWIAQGGPYGEDQSLAAVFRLFAESLENQGFGASSRMGELSELGMILENHDTTDLGLLTGDALWTNQSSIMQASSETTITDIHRQPLEDDMFAGFELEEQPCDCSCSAYTEFKAIGNMPRAQQEAHPRAMTLSMCMPECIRQWSACGEADVGSGEEGGCFPGAGEVVGWDQARLTLVPSPTPRENDLRGMGKGMTRPAPNFWKWSP